MEQPKPMTKGERLKDDVKLSNKEVTFIGGNFPSSSFFRGCFVTFAAIPIAVPIFRFGRDWLACGAGISVTKLTTVDSFKMLSDMVESLKFR